MFVLIPFAAFMMAISLHAVTGARWPALITSASGLALVGLSAVYGQGPAWLDLGYYVIGTATMICGLLLYFRRRPPSPPPPSETRSPLHRRHHGPSG